MQKHFPVFVLQTEAWPLHLQAVEQRGEKKDAMLNKARETDLKAIKSFRCQTTIHQQLKCTWKLFWYSSFFVILRAAKNRTVCQHGGSAGCRTDVLYEITIQMGFFFLESKIYLPLVLLDSTRDIVTGKEKIIFGIILGLLAHFTQTQNSWEKTVIAVFCKSSKAPGAFRAVSRNKKAFEKVLSSKEVHLQCKTFGAENTMSMLNALCECPSAL